MTVLGSLGLVGAYIVQSKTSTRTHTTVETTEKEIEELTDDIDDDEDYGTPKTVVLLDDEFIRKNTDDDDKDDKKESKSLLEIDSEDVDAVMEFLQQRMKTGKIICR